MRFFGCSGETNLQIGSGQNGVWSPGQHCSLIFTQRNLFATNGEIPLLDSVDVIKKARF